MRVLWLTNYILPEHAEAMGHPCNPVGGWMPALADALTATGAIELGIATNVAAPPWSERDINGKTYFSIPAHASRIDYAKLPSPLVQRYQAVVDRFRPHLIHVHGTEYFQGLLTGRRHLSCPAVLSIQGIIDCCCDHYWGGMPLRDILTTRTLRDWVRFDGLIEQRMRLRRRTRWEREIFASNAAFIGRTQWDRAHTYRMNRDAGYYHCAEMLRAPFHGKGWRLDKIRRHSIYASSASYPLKGFHVLVKAVALLVRDFPDLELRVPLAALFHDTGGIRGFWKSLRSSGYSNYLSSLIRKEGLQKHVVPLGVLSAEEVCRELQSAHLFALPSLLENSSNSLAEAMLLGSPSVASFTGGVPSMVEPGRSALCFPPGDAALLAEQIRSVFLDDTLAIRISEAARSTALTRHSGEAVVARMLDIYQEIAATARGAATPAAGRTP